MRNYSFAWWLKVDRKRLEARLEVAAIIVGIVAAILSFYASYKLDLVRYLFFGIIWIIIVFAILRTSIVIHKFKDS